MGDGTEVVTDCDGVALQSSRAQALDGGLVTRNRTQGKQRMTTRSCGSRYGVTWLHRVLSLVVLRAWVVGQVIAVGDDPRLPDNEHPGKMYEYNDTTRESRWL